MVLRRRKEPRGAMSDDLAWLRGSIPERERAECNSSLRTNLAIGDDDHSLHLGARDKKLVNNYQR